MASLTLATIVAFLATIMAHSEGMDNNLFATDLLSAIADEKVNENLVLSPASIHYSLALMLLGAKGDTAEEFRKVLRVNEGESKLHYASKYGDYMRSTFSKTKPENGAPQLVTATRLYVNNNLEISQKFNKLAKDNLDCQAEKVDFSNAVTAAQQINGWVEDNTNDKIKDIIQSDSLSGDTSVVVVNALYFKGDWLKPFSNLATQKTDFHSITGQRGQVDMMYTDDYFKYLELPEWKAKAVELPYNQSDMAMLLIMPDKVDGLPEVEKKLKQTNLSDIVNRMREESVDLFLPKFKVESAIDLKKPLEKLGCISAFSDNANLSGILEGDIPQKISEMKHKTVLECNEAGTEAAAATYMKITPMSLNLNQKRFRADRPFIYLVHDKGNVFFAGRVAKFD